MQTRVVWNLMVLMLLASPAFGYTDPGSGLMLLQILGAVLVGLMFHARRVVTRFWPGKRQESATKTPANGEPGLDGHA